MEAQRVKRSIAAIVVLLVPVLSGTIVTAAPARAAVIDLNHTVRISVASDGSQGNGWSGSNWVNHNQSMEFIPNSISADGRSIAFPSRANNLSAGDTNGMADVFVRDSVAGTTTRVSLDGLGQQYSYDSMNGRVSDDGRYVIFSVGPPGSWPTLFQRDLQTGITTQIAAAAGWPGMTPDGRYVVYTENSSVAYRWDRDTGERTPVSVDDQG